MIYYHLAAMDINSPDPNQSQETQVEDIASPIDQNDGSKNVETSGKKTVEGHTNWFKSKYNQLFKKRTKKTANNESQNSKNWEDVCNETNDYKTELDTYTFSPEEKLFTDEYAKISQSINITNIGEKDPTTGGNLIHLIDEIKPYCYAHGLNKDWNILSSTSSIPGQIDLLINIKNQLVGQGVVLNKTTPWENQPPQSASDHKSFEEKINLPLGEAIEKLKQSPYTTANINQRVNQCANIRRRVPETEKILIEAMEKGDEAAFDQAQKNLQALYDEVTRLEMEFLPIKVMAKIRESVVWQKNNQKDQYKKLRTEESPNLLMEIKQNIRTLQNETVNLGNELESTSDVNERQSIEDNLKLISNNLRTYEKILEDKEKDLNNYEKRTLIKEEKLEDKNTRKKIITERIEELTKKYQGPWAKQYAKASVERELKSYQLLRAISDRQFPILLEKTQIGTGSSNFVRSKAMSDVRVSQLLAHDKQIELPTKENQIKQALFKAHQIIKIAQGSKVQNLREDLKPEKLKKYQKKYGQSIAANDPLWDGFDPLKEAGLKNKIHQLQKDIMTARDPEKVSELINKSQAEYNELKKIRLNNQKIIAQLENPEFLKPFKEARKAA